MRAVYYLAFSAAVLAVMIMLNLALWLALLYLVVAGLGGVLAYRDAQARAAMQRWVQDVGNRTIAASDVATIYGGRAGSTSLDVAGTP